MSTACPATSATSGPVFEPAASDAGWAPPPGDDPLVVVSLGTTPMDEAPAVQAILDGLAGAPVRVLAMCGAHLAEATCACPPNATRTGYVRHGAVLPHADLVIDHAGLGTVLAALAHGLPQVCVPLGRDQPANAAAVAPEPAPGSCGPRPRHPTSSAPPCSTCSPIGAMRAAGRGSWRARSAGPAPATAPVGRAAALVTA